MSAPPIILTLLRPCYSSEIFVSNHISQDKLLTPGRSERCVSVLDFEETNSVLHLLLTLFYLYNNFPLYHKYLVIPSYISIPCLFDSQWDLLQSLGPLFLLEIFFRTRISYIWSTGYDQLIFDLLFYLGHSFAYWVLEL